MPARPRLALAAALLLLALPARAEPAIEDPALQTRETVLENGLVVLTLEDHTTPVVSFQMWVKVGSKDESRYTGLAHLFEHMMFKGSKHIAPEEHARLVQSRGGELNAYTTRDYTVFFENVPAEALPLVIDLEAERVANLDISQENLDSEREVVLEERRMRTEDQPRGRAQEALFSLAYKAHPYRWPVIGWRSDIEAATVEVCRDFFHTYYSPNNIVIAIAGDFDTEDALARIRRAFGPLEPVPEIPRNPQIEPEQLGERREIVRFELNSPILTAAWHAPAIGSDDAEPLEVASQVLSGGRSSRLYQSLVYQAQKALAAYGAYFDMQTSGLFYAFAAVRPDARIEDVEALFFAEIARLRDEPISEAELEKAKRQIEVALVDGLVTNEQLAARIAFDTIHYGRIRPLEERLARLHAVTAADVQRVARAARGRRGEGRRVKRVCALLGAVLAFGACAAPRPAWELPPPPASDAPLVRPGALERSELPNGMRVLTLQDRRLPRIALGLTVRRGEASVPLAQAGLASFTADLMERGAGDRDALALAQAVEGIGASLSVFAGWDSMGVRVSGLSRDLDQLLEILADVALRPRLEPAEAERLRGETLAALQRARDDPATLAAWNTARALYPEHRYGLPQAGVPESVAGLDALAAQDLHARWFVPSNAIFSASGDFERADLDARVAALFGGWTGGDPPSPGPPPPAETPAARRVVIVDRPDLEQTHITLAHEGIARTDPERIPVQLMNAVLGGSGFSSRLMKSVRAEAGLAYGVGSGFSLRRQPGPFLVSTSTRVPETRRVVDLLLAGIEGMRGQPPERSELRNAQMLAVGEFSLGLETSAAVVASLVDLDVYGLPEDSLDTYRARVRAVTPAETAEAAKRLLHPERMAIVLVGPADRLEPLAEGLGPVEVVQP
jgi:zinc protease